MARPVTLFTGQWADLPFETIVQKAKSFGYDGVELACWGDHFDIEKALSDDKYIKSRWDVLNKHGMQCHAISTHLVGQAVCDVIDERHKSILPPRIWGDGKPAGVNKRAAEDVANAARAAKKMGVKVVNGFTGSSIWRYLYSFPPTPQSMYDAGYKEFADRFNPILDVYKQEKVRFALEAHPTEIAFDIASAERAIAALKGRKEFGFNYDPSHFGYQGVDYTKFIRTFSDRIYHVHMKDVYWSKRGKDAGVFGGHTNFGVYGRFWDFRSVGRGRINFESIIRALNAISYNGPLSVEWEDSGMDREHGATESCAFVKRLDFKPSNVAFDAAFEKKK
jgi:sugar phosphate isomerase/epimerase